ncbi:RsmD family RNA methyltransferase [Costertonia aggregata]|uniref:RsmD family RNA methyltransferase n=1 Tax=Costertonia aggregata TaxID=343403 RepID=A0A7H9AT05_9FLAO|nr:RsmD family RNA methyltransferase [Costertonia aggregata]QLG46472.1 RsmD family RNA methyltransferase [Costertonia aggregata]
MRIVSGTHKGRRIIAPGKLPVRPTTDMAKEALFNILNNTYYFGDCIVLDLFTGTGNISYEFASRGAERIIAVDGHQGCVRFIEETSEKLAFGIEAIKSDVFSYLEKAKIKADIVFADPPYDMALEDYAKIPELVFKRELLVEDGILVLEHSKHMDLSQLPHFTDMRKYGGSAFSFFSI